MGPSKIGRGFTSANQAVEFREEMKQIIQTAINHAMAKRETKHALTLKELHTSRDSKLKCLTQAISDLGRRVDDLSKNRGDSNNESSAAHALAALTRRNDSITDGKNTQQRRNDNDVGADSKKKTGRARSGRQETETSHLTQEERRRRGIETNTPKP